MILMPSSVHWVQTMCCMCRDSFFSNPSALGCTHTSLLPCFLYFSVTFNANRMREEKGEEKNTGSTKESLKTLTSGWLPGLTVLKQYYSDYAAYSLLKTTHQLWLGWTKRRTESEGKEWATNFPWRVREQGNVQAVGCALGLQPGFAYV